MERARATGLTAALVLLSAMPLWSQTPNAGCSQAGPGGDACQKAIDLFGFFTPQLGMLMAGGNTTLGQAASLGGLGHFAVALRINGTRDFLVPELDGAEPQLGPPRQSHIHVEQSFGAFPVLDAAAGLYGGTDMGFARVGGVDALLNIFYVPSGFASGIGDESFSIGLPDGGMRLGYGVRIGILEESPLWPGLSLSVLQRALPRLDLHSSTAASNQDLGFGELALSDTLALRGLSVNTTVWRIVAGKSFGPLGFALGAGRDRYAIEGDIEYVIHSGFRTHGQVGFAPDVRGTNVFADVSLNLLLVRFVIEVGRVSGAGIDTYNSFSVSPDGTRSYAAIGARFGR